MKTRLVGIDLGGTKAEIVVADFDLKKNLILDTIYKKRAPSLMNKGYDQVLNNIADLYFEAANLLKVKQSLGIAIPGSISTKTGLVRNSNSAVLNHQPLAKDLEKKMKVKVLAENDANLFTLAEYTFGKYQGCHNMLGLIMGTGFGGGVILDGKLINGSNGIAGEVGHLMLDANGPKCWCGKKGCTELYLSGRALEKSYYTLSKKHASAENIYELYKANDPFAIKTIENYLEYFSQFLANMNHLLDPEIIIIGGGLSKMDILYSASNKLLNAKLLYPKFKANTVPASLGDSAGVYAAAYMTKGHV